MTIVDEGAESIDHPGESGPDELPADSTNVDPDSVVLERRVERQGRIAYYVHGMQTGAMEEMAHVRSARQYPNWDQLPERLQRVWIEVAKAVRADTLNPDWAHSRRLDEPTAPWNRVPRQGGSG